ncbi:cilia- and flagella-associated protein 206 isoform X2 [Triplophysa rosa]|uniref:cilia- and flagella-associated protein 206 isoform X2 n=1 Tax=Triplophysa rosa TaxID=992332 RepID=UPI002545F21B|nr:cilia- and flagella-associated protein 206 isoform X2 [Triplophysa rosa]
MSRTQAESVIRNIIREIAQTCLSRGPTLSETLIAFMVKAVVLDPRNHFNVDRTLTKQVVKKLIEICVDRLMDEDSPTLNTIQMQVYFDMNYTSRREFADVQQKIQQSRVQSLSRDVTDTRARSREELHHLYTKIASYIIQRSNLGSNTDFNTVRETTAALQSVFPPSELSTFMSLLKQDKEEQLKELTLIVSGIRLFNKSNSRGGEAIRDVPAVLNETLPAAAADVERELAACQRLAWQYTALLEKIIEQDTDCPVQPHVLKHSLYNTRQHEAFLKIILPHFTALAEMWAGLEGEKMLLSMLTSAASGLRGFVSAPSLLNPDQLERLLEGEQVRSDMERCSGTAGERVVMTSDMSGCEWMFPERAVNFEGVPLQYKGVCGWTLVQKKGLIVPGNPHVGVLKHREKFYAFSSRSAACEFASRADEYITAVAEMAKTSAELIQLLHLHQEFACVTPYAEMQSGQNLLVKAISKSDSSTQTEIHPLETNIVKSYEWNEWEVRRKAIKLANLRKKVTRSMQTDLSHMRRQNSTQTFLPKDAGSQTKRDGESDVPKPQVYLSGLRGQETNMMKVDLTRTIDE